MLLILWRTFSSLNAQEEQQERIQTARSVLQSIGPAISNLQELESLRANYEATNRKRNIQSLIGKVSSDSTRLAALVVEDPLNAASYQEMVVLASRMKAYVQSTLDSNAAEAGLQGLGQRVTGINIIDRFKTIGEKLESINRGVLQDAYQQSIIINRKSLRFVTLITILLVIILSISLYLIYHDIRTQRRSAAQLKEFNENLSQQVELKAAEIIQTQQQAAKELAAAENKFRNLVEQSLTGVYILTDDKFSYVNPRFSEIFGYSQEEILNNKIDMLIHPDDRAMVSENIRRRISGETDFVHYQARGLHKGGEIVPIEIYCGGRIDGVGSAIMGAVLDVKDRMRAQDDLVRSEARYRTLVENAPEALVVLDLEQGKFVSVSETAEKLFKMNADELLKLGPADLSPEFQPNGQRSTEMAMEKIMEAAHGKKPKFEWKHIDANKQEIDCEVWLVRLPAEKQILVRGSIIDISERKKTEREKEHTRYLLNERIKELTTLYRASQVFQAEHKSMDEVLQEVTNLLPAAWQFSEIAAARIASGQFEFTTSNYTHGPHRQVAEFIMPDKRIGQVEVVYLKPVPAADEDAFLDEERDLINMIAEMVRLYLARLHAAEVRKQMEKELLNQKVQEQKRITRAILQGEERERNKIGQELHDNINQILASIKLFLSLARDKSEGENAALLERSTKLIDNAINEIRTLSQRHVTPVIKVNLHELVQSLVERLNEHTQIQTSFEYDVNGQVIPDDMKLNVYRIVQEQINNVVKHAQASSLNIAIRSTDGILTLTITDNGKGFDVNRKRTGVGISNMMNRAESYNGELAMQSEEGRGSRLVVRLPINPS